MEDLSDLRLMGSPSTLKWKESSLLIVLGEDYVDVWIQLKRISETVRDVEREGKEVNGREER